MVQELECFLKPEPARLKPVLLIRYIHNSGHELLDCYSPTVLLPMPGCWPALYIYQDYITSKLREA